MSTPVELYCNRKTPLCVPCIASCDSGVPGTAMFTGISLPAT